MDSVRTYLSRNEREIEERVGTHMSGRGLQKKGKTALPRGRKEEATTAKEQGEPA